MTNILHQTTTARLQNLNSVIDSLDLRVLRFASPSPWLIQQLPKWREYHQKFDQDSDPLIIELPGIGSFHLKPTRLRHYEFVLINPEIADIRIWNPDKWKSAIEGETGQFYLSFRSKFLQFRSAEVDRFVRAVEDLFCVPLPEHDLPASVPDASGWERITRVDLATDVQMESGYDWPDLDRFVTRARVRDVNTNSVSLCEQIKQVLGTPPEDNKGGATYRVSGEFLSEVAQVMASVESGENYINRVIGKRKPQTIYFGRFQSKLYCRIYDKLASLDIQKKGYMRGVWAEGGWDGESPVWRHEFSLSGDFLRYVTDTETGLVEDLRDYHRFLDAIPRIWHYLTCEWLRYTDPDPDDSNPWRWQCSDVWAVVQLAWASPNTIVRHQKPRDPEEGQLKAQMLGVALTLSALRAGADDDCEGAIASVFSDLAAWGDSPRFQADLKRRRQVLGVDDYSDTALSALYRAERIAEGFGS